MLKRTVIAAGVLLLLTAVSLFIWAQSILASDAVRHAVESQLTQALGQPVHVGRISATIVPRVTMSLADVTIGEPAGITARALDVGTDFRALLSRRVEKGSVHVTGARIELPLPRFAFSDRTASSPTESTPAVEIISVEAITFDQLEVVSGGRVVRGDLGLSLTGRRLDITRGEFEVDGVPLSLVGTIDDMDGPTGALQLRGNSLDILRLVGFARDFSARATSAASARTEPVPPGTTPMSLTVAIETERALFGTLALERFTGRAHVTGDRVLLESASFGVFGGRAESSLSLTLADTPAFSLTSSLSGVDLASFMHFIGQQGLMTGRLTGQVSAAGQGTSPDMVIRSASGRARIDATDGTIRGLGLVKTIVLAGSMRSASAAEAHEADSTEPFKKLGATLQLAAGTATTTDVRFESPNVLFRGAGTIGLDGSGVDIAGDAQLSEALTAKAGRDLVRYTVEDGRVTLPVTISGPPAALKVRPAAGKTLKRAITNRATEEINRALGGLLGR